ncbi:hypothetical protein NQD34_017331, partial [Periophthalmus magnuspinnatus]
TETAGLETGLSRRAPFLHESSRWSLGPLLQRADSSTQLGRILAFFIRFNVFASVFVLLSGLVVCPERRGLGCRLIICVFTRGVGRWRWRWRRRP